MIYLTIALLLASSGPSQYVRVTTHDASGVEGTEFQSNWTSFAQLIADAEVPAPAPARKYEFGEIQVPFMHLPLKSLGLGLTYPDHQQETGLDKIVLFTKDVKATRIIDEIPFRESLDYEAEVSLLLHRSEPNVFGYLVHNDLTDRMIQAIEFDEKNPAPSFSKAKTFPSANAHGPLMLIGGDDVWAKLKVDLQWNGKTVQSVEPSKNLMR
ncbi:MAG: fumarylacetoacetate hydrolase family protein, partial [Bdellovibrionota bacterium]